MSPVLRTRCLPALLLPLFLILAAPAFGQQQPTAVKDEPTYLAGLIQEGQPREMYIFAILTMLRRYDVNQDGLDAGDIEIMEATEAARLRAQNVRNILIYDLDGDGRVTRDEVKRVVLGRPRGAFGTLPQQTLTSAIDRQINTIMKPDTNGDNVITYDEMRAYKPEGRASSSAQQIEMLRALLALDPNKDGQLTVNELTKLAEETFRRYDTDGNGVISGDEMAPIRGVRAAHDMDRLAKRICALPAPAKDDQVVVLGVYEGQSLSTASVMGMDEETTTGKLVIEPGNRPLYIVLTAYDGIIWQFSGATERVSQAVVIPRRNKDGPGAGVTGLPAAKVRFTAPGACYGYFTNVKESKAQRTRSIIEHAIGRPVDIFAGVYDLGSISLPSGTPGRPVKRNWTAVTGQDGGVYREFVRFYPGGLSEIDPATVVAPAPAQRYDVLPSEAGLIQLIKAGSIEARNNGVFHIVKPIGRFPAGLAGAQAVTFILGKGVPMPAGNPGHSCVISEATGAALRNTPICRMRRR